MAMKEGRRLSWDCEVGTETSKALYTRAELRWTGSYSSGDREKSENADDKIYKMQEFVVRLMTLCESV